MGPDRCDKAGLVTESSRILALPLDALRPRPEPARLNAEGGGDGVLKVINDTKSF